MMHPHDPNLTTPAFWAGMYAFLAGLTLNEIAATVGIVVAIGTFALNMYFQKRRDKRDQLRLEYEIGQHEDRRVRQVREGETP